ncbi:MAG: DUF2318 domain-containing protein, partial [Clostridium sp.]
NSKKGGNVNTLIIVIAIIGIALVGYVLLGGKNDDNTEKSNKNSNNSSSKNSSDASESEYAKLEDIVPGIEINTEELSSKAKFYPYESDGIAMEVLALKATDGSVRVTFNTCQVCYPSGRGYYIQEGDELVCQNCGNRFPQDAVGITRGGCNPVPIDNEFKAEDGSNIIIDKTFLDDNKAIFSNWKI